MQNKHKLALALGLLAVLGAAEVAQARVVVFGGTRGQVAGACTGPGRELSSGYDGKGFGWTRCVDTVRNTAVVCDVIGFCVGTYAALPQPKPKPRKPRGNYEVPESLSEQSGGGYDGIDPTAPEFEPEIVIIN